MSDFVSHLVTLYISFYTSIQYPVHFHSILGLKMADFCCFKHFLGFLEGGKIVNIAYFAHNRALTRDLPSGNTFI